MIKRAKEEPNRGGGDSCCGPPSNTPDGIIERFLPELTETLLEVLSEKPFNDSTELKSGSGSTFTFKGE